MVRASSLMGLEVDFYPTVLLPHLSSSLFVASSPVNFDTTVNDIDRVEDFPPSRSEPGYVEQNVVRNSILSGSVAGMVSCILFHPLDVLRTKMQSSTNMIVERVATSVSAKESVAGLSSAALRAGGASGPAVPAGPLAVMAHTIQYSGIRALYTGLSLPLTAQAVYKSTVFTVNKVTKNALVEMRTKERSKTGNFAPYKLSLGDYYVCGATSGAINAWFFVSPVEYVRNQLIAQHSRLAHENGEKLVAGARPLKHVLNGPMDVVRHTIRTTGVLGLWRGAGVTVVRDSLGCGAFFVMFELGQEHLPKITGAERGSLVNTIGSGIMAGSGYWGASLPLDSIKTLVQTGKAPSAFQTISILANRDGVYGMMKQLFRGWQVAFGRGAPSAAVTLSTYTAAYQFCSRVLD